MACPGLHCAGCGAGVSVPPVAFAVAFGAAWVLEHIVEVAIVSAVSGVLAVAAVVALMRWCDRRQARAAASRPIWTVREVPGVRAPGPLPAAAWQELGSRAVHLHFHGLPADQQAAIIRTAIPGTKE